MRYNDEVKPNYQKKFGIINLYDRLIKNGVTYTYWKQLLIINDAPTAYLHIYINLIYILFINLKKTNLYVQTNKS